MPVECNRVFRELKQRYVFDKNKFSFVILTKKLQKKF